MENVEEKKTTIDERLEALTHNLELASLDLEAWKERQKRLDARERRARQAILDGITAYLRVLNEEPDAEA